MASERGESDFTTDTTGFTRQRKMWVGDRDEPPTNTNTSHHMRSHNVAFRNTTLFQLTTLEPTTPETKGEIEGVCPVCYRALRLWRCLNLRFTAPLSLSSSPLKKKKTPPTVITSRIQTHTITVRCDSRLVLTTSKSVNAFLIPGVVCRFFCLVGSWP
jgi:hypothetical protein